jgi:solute carrier family 26 (sodium-independent sulfate anion transporter), member 11
MYINKRSVTETTQRILRDFPQNSKKYLTSLFPFLNWIHKYNGRWFFSDMIAGLTVGVFVIPQCLAYCKLANLPIQYGLYSSFVSCLLYFIFGTSKDVTIGTTAVSSTLVGQLIMQNAEATGLGPEKYAVALAFASGFLELAIGLFRIADIVDLIPNPVMAGFTTGAVCGIIIGQITPLLGITGVNKKSSTIMILVDTLVSMPRIQIDALFGISALILLIAFRFLTGFMLRKGHGWFQWIGQSTNFLTIVLFSIISFLINIGKEEPIISVVGDVPSGLNYVALPNMNDVVQVIGHTPAVILVSALELMAVAKAFGRINRYNADPNQEMIAIGIGNAVGSIFGSYPTTGAFSRSSIQSRAGSKTPFTGVFTAGMVFLAIFFITPAFKFIPSAVLAAMIINALSDLLSKPGYVKQLWKVDFNDFVAFSLATILTFFYSIETAVYVSMLFSVLVVLYRVARPQVQPLVKNNSAWVGATEVDVLADSKPAPPGFALFRISESLSYLNNNYLFQVIREWIQNHTILICKTGEEQWCETYRQNDDVLDDIWVSRGTKAKLQCVILDFSGVNGIDASGLQTLIDIRREVAQFAGKDVPFYFVHVRSDLRRVLEYFETLFRPVPLVDHEAYEPQNETELAEWVELYAAKDVYCQQFFCDTVDDAIVNAIRRCRRESTSTLNSAHVILEV